jgi:hypothetical protein
MSDEKTMGQVIQIAEARGSADRDVPSPTFRCLNRGEAKAPRPSRQVPIPSFTSAFGGIADMAGAAAGLVAVANDAKRKWLFQSVCVMHYDIHQSNRPCSRLGWALEGESYDKRP